MGVAGAAARARGRGRRQAPPPARCCWSRTMRRSPKSARAYFEQLGYQVKLRGERASWSRSHRSDDGDIDLVFSDILMPGGMNGLDWPIRCAAGISGHRGAVDHRIQFQRSGRGAPGFRGAAEALRPCCASACAALGAKRHGRTFLASAAVCWLTDVTSALRIDRRLRGFGEADRRRRGQEAWRSVIYL